MPPGYILWYCHFLTLVGLIENSLCLLCFTYECLLLLEVGLSRPLTFPRLLALGITLHIVYENILVEHHMDCHLIVWGRSQYCSKRPIDLKDQC